VQGEDETDTEARRGAGSYVKSRPSERWHAHMSMEELSATLGTYEVRFVLESEAARLAAIRRSAEQMAEINHALADLRAALLSSEPAHDEDWLLHRSICKATANPAFLASFDHLHGEIDRVLRAGVDISRSRPPEVIHAMMREHEMVVEEGHDLDQIGERESVFAAPVLNGGGRLAVSKFLDDAPAARPRPEPGISIVPARIPAFGAQ